MSETTAGTISALMIVASIRIPAPSPVAKTLTSVPGLEASATKERKRINAALVTSRPVRPMPRITAVSVEPGEHERETLRLLLRKLAGLEDR